MSAQHTPGPWRSQETPRGQSVLRQRDDHSTATIAICYDSRAEADACLIAEAPAMLAALEECADSMQRCGYVAGVSPTLDLVQSVIARAKGEEA